MKSRYLIDTHILLWWLDSHSPLKPPARHMIDDGGNEIVVSAASLWEISIKKEVGKLKAPDDLLEILEQNNVTILPINAHHAYAVHALPRFHGDPFDRLLIMQAHLENMGIITHDKAFEAYRGSWIPLLHMV